MRAATVAWKLRGARSDGRYFGHFHDLVTTAHEEGAELVVFPEYHCLELLALASDVEDADVPLYLVQFADELEAWIARISGSSNMIIVGGSHLRRTERGVVCACAVGDGFGGVALVERTRLSPYEREVWGLTPGEASAGSPDARLAVTLGLDAFSGAAASAPAKLQAIPTFAASAREALAQRWIAHARAAEFSRYALLSVLVGGLDRAPVRTAYGTSAILSPNAEGFPESGIVGATEPGEESVLVRTLDLDALPPTA